MELRHKGALVQYFDEADADEAKNYLENRSKTEADWTLEEDRPVRLLYRGVLLETFYDRDTAVQDLDRRHREMEAAVAARKRPPPPGVAPDINAWKIIGGE